MVGPLKDFCSVKERKGEKEPDLTLGGGTKIYSIRKSNNVPKKRVRRKSKNQGKTRKNWQSGSPHLEALEHEGDSRGGRS